MKLNLQFFGGRGSSSGINASTSSGGNASSYKVSDVPSRIESFTTTGKDANGEEYQSRTYVTRSGNAIKTVTTYDDGTKTTYTDAQNYGTEYDRSRTEFESMLSDMAKSNIRAGVNVSAINGKKKKNNR